MRLEPCDSVVQATTATQIIVGRPCILQGCLLTPAAASCTVALYDPAPTAFSPITQGIATTVGATLRVVLQAAAAGGTVTSDISAHGIAFNNGIIAVVTGAGAQATIVTATI
jgi:hypothetical protein